MYLLAVPPIVSAGQMETTILYVLGVIANVSPTTTKTAQNNVNVLAALQIVSARRMGTTIRYVWTARVNVNQIIIKIRINNANMLAAIQIVSAGKTGTTTESVVPLATVSVSRAIRPTTPTARSAPLMAFPSGRGSGYSSYFPL